MQKPRITIPVAEPDLSEVEEALLLSAYRSGWISSIGEYISRFENEFAGFCGADHGIAVTNGTVALQLALLVAGVKEGDEVIVPTLSFVATASVVCHIGARPVFCDCEPEIGTIDTASLERLITPRTKAIVPVHLYGHPADMDPIMAIAAKHGLKVIEDAAEAHGAKYKGRPVGSIGHLSAFSFYGNKIVTTGEGGMVLTNDAGLASRVRFLKDHAMDPKRRYWHPEIGYNFRMTNLQAAIGCGQLQRVDQILARRSEVLTHYRGAFSDLGDVKINPSRSWADPVSWLVCAILPAGFTAKHRNHIAAQLAVSGIDTRPYFNLISDMDPYIRYTGSGSKEALFPISRELSERGMNLPSSPSLQPDAIHQIHEVFSTAFREC